MEPLGDKTVLLAAFVATFWLLACFGIAWRATHSRTRTGGLPWWGHSALIIFLVGSLGLYVASEEWLFASYVYMTGGGIFAGACAAYYGLRAVLSARAWWSRRA